MMRYREKILCVGMLQVNCTVLADTEKQILYIIDPGEDFDRIVEAAGEFAGYPHKMILLTHAHVDHIFAVGKVAEALHIDKIYLHPGDRELYFSRENHLLPYMPLADGLPDPSWPPENTADMEVIHCPGHSLGGTSYYFKEMGKLYTGDTIFRQSIGRTDFPGGDYDTLIHTIRSKIFTLPDDLLLLPGHGPETTIGFEKKNNPYLQDC